MKFEIIAGKHSEINAQGIEETYGPGAVVESKRELNLIYKNKFKVRDEDAKVSKPIKVGNEILSTTLQDAPKAAKVSIDVDIDEKDDIDDPDEPEVTLKAKNRGKKRWDVVKVIDGKETEEEINDDYLIAKEAKAIAKAGYEKWLEDNED